MSTYEALTWRPVGSASRRSDQRRVALEVTATSIAVAVALVMWAISLNGINLSRSGTSGLLGVAPPEWYAALVVLLLGAVAHTWSPVSRRWLFGLQLAALVLVVEGTIPALSPVPQYVWVYKHIGVISLLEAQGHTSPAVDIYNRWPGMFALAAALSKLSGVSPLLYANWVEPLFTLINAWLVGTLATKIMGDERSGRLAALVFVCTNWVGQTYLSPQTFAFTLQLGFFLLLIGQLRGAGTRAKRLVATLSRRLSAEPLSETFAPAPTMSRYSAVALVLLIGVIIVPSHQLTPFMLLIELGVLVALDAAGSGWLWLTLALLTVAYLAPNVSYLQQHYSLISGFDLSNATVGTEGLVENRAALFAVAGRFVSLGLAAVALIAAVRLVRAGRANKVVPLLALGIAPTAILVFQNYGGEAPLRVFLFASPWLSVLAGAGLAQLRARTGPTWSAVTLVSLTAACLCATVSNSAISVIPKDEVAASLYVQEHAPRGSVIALVGSNFPTYWTARYPTLAGALGDSQPDLLTDVRELARRSPWPGDVSLIVADLHKYSRRAFVVFSTSQREWASIYRTVPLSRLAGIERQVAGSPQFHLYFRNADTRIYQLTSAAPQASESEGR